MAKDPSRNPGRPGKNPFSEPIARHRGFLPGFPRNPDRSFDWEGISRVPYPWRVLDFPFYSPLFAGAKGPVDPFEDLFKYSPPDKVARFKDAWLGDAAVKRRCKIQSPTFDGDRERLANLIRKVWFMADELEHLSLPWREALANVDRRSDRRTLERAIRLPYWEPDELSNYVGDEAEKLRRLLLNLGVLLFGILDEGDSAQLKTLADILGKLVEASDLPVRPPDNLGNGIAVLNRFFQKAVETRELPTKLSIREFANADGKTLRDWGLGGLPKA